MSILIKLDNPGILSPGATITGTVTCRFHTEENIRGIECSLRGKEYTRWTTGSGRSKTTYIGNHKFISEDITLVGQGEMEVGVYEYSFLFKIPDRILPSSFTHKIGSIQYYVKAKVDRPFAIDYNDKVALHVACPIDFNKIADQILMKPVSTQFEKFPSYCFCTSEPINLDLRINKDAFVIGEIIKIKLHVENTSDLRIQQINMALLSKFKFHSETPAKREREASEVIVEETEVGFGGRSERTYRFKLRVPEILIPNFPECNLIEHTWAVRAQVVFPTLHSNIDNEIIIKLGHIPIGNQGVIVNVPIRESATPYPVGPPTGGHPMPSAPLAREEEMIPLIIDNEPSAPPQIDPVTPPPSYADVTKHY